MLLRIGALKFTKAEFLNEAITPFSTILLRKCSLVENKGELNSK